ncbi:MAG: glycoside hydrolase family 43 protein [Lentisphaerota bacterium]
MMYQNPVISGFHPDPSVCRVGEDYYLVNSSFEYFPGVPLFHSRDLIHWRQIGHCLTRKSQLPLDKAVCSGGIFAPTIRHHQGVFYMVTTNFTQGGNFFVTTKDIRGEWSDPIWVDQPGIDPSLFFDEDGKVYFTSTGERGISQSEVDVATGKRNTDIKVIWSGTGGSYPEGPHLYKIQGWYYLMIAEGGTEYGHMETMARSRSPWGPFEPCPRNPILSHRSTILPIQATGHADLVQAQNGSWWLVFLGIRPARWERLHHLGRETFLSPVHWADDGWPVIGVEGRVDLEMEADATMWHPEYHELPGRDDFNQPSLKPCWNFLRNPNEQDWSLSERPGWMRLRGSAVSLDEADSSAFVGRRQEHFDCRVATLMDFQPSGEGEEAGLTVLRTNLHHYDLARAWYKGADRIILRRRIGPLVAVEATAPAPSGPVVLIVTADRDKYQFSFSTLGGSAVPLGEGESRYLSSEVTGGFTGVYFGLYSTGHGRACSSPAWFDGLDYTVTTEVEKLSEFRW